MSLPYIAALTYIACLDESGTVVKSSATTILDAMLRIAQSSNIVAGTAEHALVSYWNQLSATPGSKDRDLEIVGPFIKAVKAILDGEKITAAKLKLTKKEVEAYKTAPPLFSGWDENSFIIAAEKRATFIESVQQMKEEAAKAKVVAQAEKEAAKEKAKAEKEAEKEKAKVEAEAAKTKIANSGIMAAAKKKAPAGIKRKPVAA
jgi:septum formation inhibitor MinC